MHKDVGRSGIYNSEKSETALMSQNMGVAEGTVARAENS